MRLVLGVALALVLTACGGAEELGPVTLPPVQSPTAASASPSPSPSPSREAPPAMPALAREHTAEGASAFATFFFDTASYSFRTADPAPLEALSAPECKSCAVLVRLVTELADEGQRREGGEYEVLSAVAPPMVDDEVNTGVDVSYQRSPSKTLAADDTTSTTSKAVPPTRLLMSLNWSGTAWETTGYAFYEDGQ